MKKFRWAIGILAAAAVLAVGTAANEAVELEETVVEAETAVTAEATEGYYTYTVSNGEATITDCSTSIRGDITIPSELGGYPVTKIRYQAFYSCTGLTSVTIPEKVTSIGWNAFASCTGLTSVIIPSTVTTMGYYCFDGCTNLKTAGPIGGNYNIQFGWTTTIPSYAFDSSEIESVEIPTTVTYIDKYAFNGCGNLTEITLPSRIKEIGESTFYGCNSLTSVTIPEKVTSIGQSAFSNCTGLTSVTIPATVTTIGYCCFDGCTNLKTAGPIGGGYDYEFGWTTTIPSYAFDGCSGMTSVIIPATVTTMGYNCFDGCTNLKTAGPIGGDYNIQFGWTTTIPSYAFYSSEIESVEIPTTVTYIGKSAFYNCGNLTEITLPGRIKEIGASTFYGCNSLTSVTIPEKVTSIGWNAFKNCTGLTSVTIPDSVTEIGSSAFYGCGQLDKNDPNGPSLLCVYFKGNAPSVSAASYSSPSFPATATLYYLDGTTGWTDSTYYDPDEETWHGYALYPYGTVSSLRITSVDYITADLFDDDTVTLTVTVKNIGTADVSDFTIHAGDNTPERYANTIPAGNSASVTYTYTLEDTASVEVTITDEKGGTDTKTVTVGAADLSLLAESNHSGIVTVTLDNLGNIPADGTVNIYANNKNGALLHTESVTLGAGETTEIDFTLTDTSVKKVFVTVTAEDEDIFPDDNLDYCRVSWASAEPYDFSGDGRLDIDDALALFRYSMLPTVYPIPLPW